MWKNKTSYRGPWLPEDIWESARFEGVPSNLFLPLPRNPASITGQCRRDFFKEILVESFLPTVPSGRNELCFFVKSEFKNKLIFGDIKV